MIKAFIDIWDKHKQEIEDKYKKGHPSEYKDIVVNLVEILNKHIEEYEDKPDPDRIKEIDWGDYQGTLAYVIGADGYQPSDFWYVTVSYGSCSGCDTLQDICGYSDNKPDKEQIEGYMTLTLHILQGLKKMEDYTDD